MKDGPYHLLTAFGLIVALLIDSQGNAQTPLIEAPPAAKASALPTDWYGQWSGQVQTSSAQGTQSFQMQLTIEPTDAEGRWNWTIVYDGQQGKSTRRYLLVKETASESAAAPGQFVIDEQNGIRINASLLGNALCSNFTVGGQRIWSNYRLENSTEGKRIHFELMTADEAGEVKSGGDSGVPEVKSLKPSSRQVAVLTFHSTRSAAEKQIILPSWSKLETEPYRGKQDDIFFIDENTGWYVNGAGMIFKTVDGGKSWTKLLEKPGTFFRCLAFLDPQHGFAGNIGPDYFPNVTDKVPLYETLDGGQNWQPVTTIEGKPIVGLCAMQVLREEFINAGNLESRIRLIGVGRVGGPTSMIVSDDLGKTWQQIDISQSAAMAFDVQFFNRNEGFIAAASSSDLSESHALILSTSDGGKSWQKAWQSERPFETTWKIAFPSRQVGYITIQSYNPDPKVSQRFVAKTTDAGKTWTEVQLVDDPKVREFGIAFLDENVGWVGAVPNGFQTIDGGKSWQAINFGNAVNKIRLLKTNDKHVGYAIGTNVYRIDIPLMNK